MLQSILYVCNYKTSKSGNIWLFKCPCIKVWALHFVEFENILHSYVMYVFTTTNLLEYAA